MLGVVIRKVLGTRNERELKRLRPLLERINALEPQVRALRDEQLSQKTAEFKERLSRGETLDELLPEAFALVRETARRVLGERHFDVQILGGIVLHQGKVAEMATGEGKTLVATLPAYLNALTGKGVHIVTVNDYLARRDRDWMGPIYERLGLSVGVIYHDMDLQERKQAYQADITYGTNTEFGFDYLRDNLAVSAEELVQRGHHYAIVDEADSILIDEARTPLIISGPVEHVPQGGLRELKGKVERLVRAQNALVASVLAQAERLLQEGKEGEAGMKLLQALRGAPKNKRLLKLLKDTKVRKLVDRAELACLRDRLFPQLDEELYFTIDEKTHVVDLTERGRAFLSPQDPEAFVLPDLSQVDADSHLSPTERELRRRRLEREYLERSERIQNITQLLRAYSLFERDVDYVVSDGKVIIVDEFTGRLLPGRRYSEGLHQALEAKEGVTIERETQTLATITIQNYFRMYEKLAGMTGTAETEAQEFWEIYRMDVVVIPTNQPVRRIDYPDLIFRTKAEKYRAVVEEISRAHATGRPILVGTTSVEVSELLSRMLRARGIKHSVLNAKRHKEEAEIIARAGQRGAVTIATNMAGRGTDIKLGPGVVRCQRCCIRCELERQRGCRACDDPQKRGQKLRECFQEVPCGLYVIGTERHEARRIDRQLRGRSGRQGDPGSSRFFVSLEDDLLRIFGSDRISGLMERLGMQDGQPIEHPMVTKALENAQARVEARNFEIRKHLLEYDDVLNKQREVIYAERRRALEGQDLSQRMLELAEEEVEELLEELVPERGPWNPQALQEALLRSFGLRLSLDDGGNREDLRALVITAVQEAYRRKESELGEAFRQLERLIYLQAIDRLWREHLQAMEDLREGIGLRGYGQRNPLHEYQREGYDMFLDLLRRVRQETLRQVFNLQLGAQLSMPMAPLQLILSRGEEESERPKPVRRKGKKVGRNDPCPCGSGKKYKHCCGRR